MPPAAGSPVTNPGEVSVASTVHSDVKGDWVLFHPVYSQEELRSVEVSLAFTFYLSQMIWSGEFI